MKHLYVVMVVVVVALAGCAAQPQQPVDAGPVMQGGAQLTSAFGAKVTGRDWRAQPSESRGTAGNGDGL